MTQNAQPNQYASNLTACRENIDRHWVTLSETPNDSSAQQALTQDIHTLLDATTAIGCDTLCALALELKKMLGTVSLNNESQLNLIKCEIDQLVAVMDEAILEVSPQASESPDQPTASSATSSTTLSKRNPKTHGLKPLSASMLTRFSSPGKVTGISDIGDVSDAKKIQKPLTEPSESETSEQAPFEKPQPKLFMSEHPREASTRIDDYSTLPHQKHVVYIVEDDPILVEFLLSELAYFHYEIQIIPDLKTLQSKLAEAIPTVALVDIRLPDGKSTDFFRKFRKDYPTIPLIFTSATDDIRSRVATIEAGGEYFLKKPYDLTRLVQLLDRISQPHADDSVRVMIVPEAQETGAQVGAVLSDAGCEVCLLDSPWRILEAAEKVRPDIILVSTNYSRCSGRALADALRQEDDFISTPIMFLSEMDDETDNLRRGSIGGDSFVHTISEPDILVAEVIAKAQYHRRLVDIISRDNLTGCYTHTAIMQQVNRDFHQARENKLPYSLAVIGLDDFKILNERFGHIQGDHALCNLTHFLRKHIDNDANIGRYGGGEFLLSLPNTSGEAAIELITCLQLHFTKTCKIAMPGPGMTQTFSAGIAAHPTYDSVAELLYMADQSLYEARRIGKCGVQQL